MRRVDPGNGRRSHAEVQVIADRVRIACLGIGTPDLLFDFPEAGFDFPARRIMFHDLLDAEREVRGHQGDPLRLAADPSMTPSIHMSQQPNCLVGPLHLERAAGYTRQHVLGIVHSLGNFRWSSDAKCKT
jgi:hypothetical protein